MTKTHSSPGITEAASKPVSDLDKELATTTATEMTDADTAICKLTRDQILACEHPARMRWFFLLQIKHAELERVLEALSELLEPQNEVKIISLIGMTGIGKTTLLGRLLAWLVSKFNTVVQPHEVSIIYVAAPANGSRSLSWTVLYQRFLTAGHEPPGGNKLWMRRKEDGSYTIRSGKPNLAELRESVERMLQNREVRVLVVDEALHLLRFDNYAATMDTLKSLADAHSCKLLLVGHFDLTELVCSYGQLFRRGEIIHYRRYKPEVVLRDKLTDDQRHFREVVRKLQEHWPNHRRPNLVAIWIALMRLSLGSVGLLKMGLIRLATLQSRKNGVLTADMIKRSFKSPKALQQLEEETVVGEKLLQGRCYGDHGFTEDEIKAALEPVEEVLHG